MNYGPASFYEDHKRPRGFYAQPKKPVGRPRKLIPPPTTPCSAQAIVTLRDLVGTTGLTLHAIIRAVCIATNVASRDFLSPTKGARNITDARQVYYYLGHEVLRYDYSAIGRRCGRDHSTVISGVKKVGANLAKYADTIAAAKKLLGVE